MPEPAPETGGNAPIHPYGLKEVRYALPEMLKEVEQERRDSSFAMETLDQIEIRKMFAKRRHHVRRKK